MLVRVTTATATRLGPWEYVDNIRIVVIVKRTSDHAGPVPRVSESGMISLIDSLHLDRPFAISRMSVHTGPLG